MTRHWRLSLPGGPHLTANQRLHWSERGRRTAYWRFNTRMVASAARMPALTRISVHLEIHPPDRRRRDPSNWMPTQKACVDGLVDARVVPDDSPAYVVEGMPRLIVPAGPGGWEWWLVVIEALPPAEQEAATSIGWSGVCVQPGQLTAVMEADTIAGAAAEPDGAA